MKDRDGTIETLKRQLVQAGIKGKIMQGEMEVNRKVAETKASQEIQRKETQVLQSKIREDGLNYARENKDKIKEMLNNVLPVKEK